MAMPGLQVKVEIDREPVDGFDVPVRRRGGLRVLGGPDAHRRGHDCRASQG